MFCFNILYTRVYKWLIFLFLTNKNAKICLGFNIQNYWFCYLSISLYFSFCVVPGWTTSPEMAPGIKAPRPIATPQPTLTTSTSTTSLSKRKTTKRSILKTRMTPAAFPAWRRRSLWCPVTWPLLVRLRTYRPPDYMACKTGNHQYRLLQHLRRAFYPSLGRLISQCPKWCRGPLYRHHQYARLVLMTFYTNL